MLGYLEIRLKIKVFLKYQLWKYLLVSISICSCCILCNRVLEGISFCVAHIVLRYKYDMQYHSPKHCLLLTNLIIWVCIPILFSVTKVLLYSIPIASLICWFGNEAQTKLHYKTKSYYFQNNYEKLKRSTEVHYTDRQQIILLAKAKGLKGEKLIDYVYSQGYDCSTRTLAREIKKIKELQQNL